MIVSQQLIQKVNGFRADEALIVGVDKALPALPGESAQNVVVLCVELNVVFVKVLKQLVGTEDLRNLHQLVGVALAMEERLFSKDHRCKHSPQRPHVQRIVVFLEVHQQLWSLEVPRRNAHIVLGALVVELGQTPVDEPQLSLLVIDHNVVRLDVSVHDALGMTEVERLEEFENVVPDVVVDETWVEGAEVGVVDILKDQARSLTLAVPDDVQQSHDIGTSGQILQDLDLTLYLLLLDRLQNLDDTLLVVGDIDALEDFGVFAPT